jgi:hypothetical protein
MMAASDTFAQQIPTAPKANCIFATTGDLCILLWGRKAIPFARLQSAMVFRFDSSSTASSRRHGVGKSLTGIGDAN